MAVTLPGFTFLICKMGMKKCTVAPTPDIGCKIKYSMKTLNVINVSYSHHYSFCTGDCIRFSSVTQLCLTLATPWTVARQASLSITNSWSLPKHMSIETVMPSNHLILCHHSLLFLPSIFPNIRVFTDESAFCIRWPKYWSFSFSISPSNEHPGLISFRVDWFDLLVVRGTLKSHL